MTQLQTVLHLRKARVAVAALFLWCSVFERTGRSQNFPLLEINKLPKPCFAETEELPSPPLSQTELSVPNLWLDKDIYTDVIQRKDNLPVQQKPVTEADTKFKDFIEKQSQNNRLPNDLIVADNPLLDTWFVQNQDFIQLSPTLEVNNLVTLVVNRQKWAAERYIGQYVFLNRFGTTAREYGYNLRVCNHQGTFLGYYICDFQTAPLNCQVSLRSEGFRLRDFRVFEMISPE